MEGLTWMSTHVVDKLSLENPPIFFKYSPFVPALYLDKRLSVFIVLVIRYFGTKAVIVSGFTRCSET
jgi:hypothetical protein